MILLGDILFWFSVVVLSGLGIHGVYLFGYKQGYGHGFHNGLSAGMFNAYNRINKKKVSSKR